MSLCQGLSCLAALGLLILGRARCLCQPQVTCVFTSRAPGDRRAHRHGGLVLRAVGRWSRLSSPSRAGCDSGTEFSTKGLESQVTFCCLPASVKYLSWGVAEEGDGRDLLSRFWGTCAACCCPSGPITSGVWAPGFLLVCRELL